MSIYTPLYLTQYLLSTGVGSPLIRLARSNSFTARSTFSYQHLISDNDSTIRKPTQKEQLMATPQRVSWFPLRVSRVGAYLVLIPGFSPTPRCTRSLFSVIATAYNTVTGNSDALKICFSYVCKAVTLTRFLFLACPQRRFCASCSLRFPPATVRALREPSTESVEGDVFPLRSWSRSSCPGVRFVEVGSARG